MTQSTSPNLTALVAACNEVIGSYWVESCTAPGTVVLPRAKIEALIAALRPVDDVVAYALALATDTTETLTAELQAYCARHSLPQWSADDLLASNVDVEGSHHAYLDAFCHRWDLAVEREASTARAIEATQFQADKHLPWDDPRSMEAWTGEPAIGPALGTVPESLLDAIDRENAAYNAARFGGRS